MFPFKDAEVVYKLHGPAKVVIRAARLTEPEIAGDVDRRKTCFAVGEFAPVGPTLFKAIDPDIGRLEFVPFRGFVAVRFPRW